MRRQSGLNPLTALLHRPDTGLFLLRLSIGGLMLFHGVHKLIHGIDGIIGMTTAKGLPTGFAYGVYLGELIAPVCILIGWMVRPAAMGVAFTMVMSIYLAFGWQGFAINPFGGITVELNALYFFGALALVFTGGGAYGIQRVPRLHRPDEPVNGRLRVF
ncbi:DoxX family protein [bacterium]|nr:DoxX family protein [candidate division CSSED10-310 bacterium]